MKQEIYLICKQVIEKNPEIIKSLRYLLFQYNFSNPVNLVFDSGVKLKVTHTIGQALGVAPNVSDIEMLDVFNIPYKTVDYVEKLLKDKVAELYLTCWVDKFITAWNIKVPDKRISYNLGSVKMGLHKLGFEDNLDELFIGSYIPIGEETKNLPNCAVEFSLSIANKASRSSKILRIKDVSVEKIKTWVKNNYN